MYRLSFAGGARAPTPPVGSEEPKGWVLWDPTGGVEPFLIASFFSRPTPPGTPLLPMFENDNKIFSVENE